MSRTTKAAISASLTLTRMLLSIVTGLVLFPLLVRHIGTYDMGLWIASGELAGHLLVGDIGVFAVIPWLVAEKDGANDRRAIASYLSNALAIGGAIGILMISVGFLPLLIDNSFLDIDRDAWSRLRPALGILIIGTGLSFPLKAFTAILYGLQDSPFNGIMQIIEAILVAVATGAVLASGTGLIGLALATTGPPLLTGIVACFRTRLAFADLFAEVTRPTWQNCRLLLRQGFGPWISSIGVRLLAASNGMILACIGRPDAATVLAATSKATNVLTPLCTLLPDSGLIGLGQQIGERAPARTASTIACLLALYILVPGAAAMGILVGNAAFVRSWIGGDLYAGHYVSVLLAANLVISSLGGGLFKIVTVSGHRTVMGLATLVSGAFFVLLGLVLGQLRGTAGVVEATLLTSLLWLVPVGLMMLRLAYKLTAPQMLGPLAVRWTVRAVSLGVACALLGSRLESASLPLALICSAAACLCYALLMRRLFSTIPWPRQVALWLSRVRMIPSPQ